VTRLIRLDVHTAKMISEANKTFFLEIHNKSLALFTMSYSTKFYIICIIVFVFVLIFFIAFR